RKARNEIRRIAAKAMDRRDGGEQVAHVVTSEQRRLDLKAAARPLEAEGRALEPEVHLRGAHLRRRILAEGHGRYVRWYQFEHAAAVRIIDVDDRDTGHRADRPGEQPRLHREVLLERLVVVQVIACQIREYS